MAKQTKGRSPGGKGRWRRRARETDGIHSLRYRIGTHGEKLGPWAGPIGLFISTNGSPPKPKRQGWIPTPISQSTIICFALVLGYLAPQIFCKCCCVDSRLLNPESLAEQTAGDKSAEKPARSPSIRL